MACSKAHRFDIDEYHFSLIANAFSHPARIRIIEKLVHSGECSFKQLRKGMVLSHNAVSQHLRSLREAQLIRIREECPYSYYRMNEDLGKTLLLVKQFLRLLRQDTNMALTLEELQSIARVRGISIGDSRLGN